jgi:hypothetical protein
MITKIRPATYKDLPEIMPIYDIARDFMRSTGNEGQWINGYPTEKFITEEIEAGHSFICENSAGEIVGTFCFIIGEDPTYLKIYDLALLLGCKSSNFVVATTVFLEFP